MSNQNLGQQHLITFCKSAFKKGTIPHALLFTGVDGSGKAIAAKQMAMACNCLNCIQGFSDIEQITSPCGECKPCQKILSGNHPDILWVEPSGVSVKIDQIRQIRTQLATRILEAKIRVIVIYNAHKMTPESSNALLKILEEPPPDTLLILISPNKGELLPTITSRCQEIRFHPVPVDYITDMLVKDHNMEYSIGRAIAMLSNGNISKAKEMASPKWLNKRRWILSEMNSIHERSIAILLALAEKLSNDKDDLQDILDIIASWFRDLIIYQFCPDKIINHDRIGEIQNAVNLFDFQRLQEIIFDIQNAQKNIQRANKRLILESLLLKFYTK